MLASGFRTFFAAFVAMAAACACWAQDPLPLKYDLRVGDHLIYRQTVERDVKSSDREIATRAVFRSHVLIMGQAEDRLSVGRQRNRESAELTKYVGADGGGFQAAQARFDERTAKSAKWFADAQEFGLDGASVNPPDPELTGASKLISAIHELEPLPREPVRVGYTWSPNASGATFRVVNIGSDAGNTIVEVASEGASRIAERFWFNSQQGLITRAEVEGDYKMSAMTDVHTRITFELLERRRDENPKFWLSDPDLRNAALEAYLSSRWLPRDPKAIRPLTVASDTRTRELARTLLPGKQRSTHKRKARRR